MKLLPLLLAIYVEEEDRDLAERAARACGHGAALRQSGKVAFSLAPATQL